ncbi:transposase [Streptomyces sp. NPDC058691]|uniref:IS110 family transposase n=1 Tax=Streptomyces sp. NPDC058691 TaxID=3346601 RepID=UPI003647987C
MRPGHSRRREWFKRGLHCPTLVCPPRRSPGADHEGDTAPSRRSADAASGRVNIAIDPHKASWTAVAVDTRLRTLNALRVPVSRAGYQDLLRFARRWPEAIWAIEGAGGLGAPLTSGLAADGIAPTDVPAKLARRVRLLSTGHGRTSDEADALSVGIAAHTATSLGALHGWTPAPPAHRYP